MKQFLLLFLVFALSCSESPSEPDDGTQPPGIDYSNAVVWANVTTTDVLSAGFSGCPPSNPLDATTACWPVTFVEVHMEAGHQDYGFSVAGPTTSGSWGPAANTDSLVLRSFLWANKDQAAADADPVADSVQVFRKTQSGWLLEGRP